MHQADGGVRIDRTGKVRMSDTGGVNVANTGVMGDVTLPGEPQ